jgi:hypothetical protein
MYREHPLCPTICECYSHYSKGGFFFRISVQQEKDVLTDLRDAVVKVGANGDLLGDVDELLTFS